MRIPGHTSLRRPITVIFVLCKILHSGICRRTDIGPPGSLCSITADRSQGTRWLRLHSRDAGRAIEPGAHTRPRRATVVEVVAQRRSRGPPRDYLVDGAEWPTGLLRSNAPPTARLLKAIATRLNQAIGDKSLREVAELCDVASQTVRNIRTGATWGDVTTIAQLERGLNIDLWGQEHRQRPEGRRHRGRPTRRTG